jgi:hypothetical protein
MYFHERSIALHTKNAAKIPPLRRRSDTLPFFQNLCIIS